MSKRVEPFWVMAIEHDPDNAINSKIIIEPKVILAKNKEAAKFQTTVELGVEGHTNIYNIEVFVTPFVVLVQ